MSHLKKILVFIKKSKLNYLNQKYGELTVQSSSEYNLLKDSMIVHYRNCDNFIKQLEKTLSKEQKFDVFYDDFEKYSNFEDFAEAKKSNYDLIFSLGGDGTFLRSLNFNNSNEQLVIGLNTDGKHSTGFYCGLNSMDGKIEEKIRGVFQNKFKQKFLNKLKVDIVSDGENANCFVKGNDVTQEINNNSNCYGNNSKDSNFDNKYIRSFESLCRDDKRNGNSNKVGRSYNFINDLYFGEKFSGRISKCQLQLGSEEKAFSIKSSGLIVSTCNFFFSFLKNKFERLLIN